MMAARKFIELSISGENRPFAHRQVSLRVVVVDVGCQSVHGGEKIADQIGSGK